MRLGKIFFKTLLEKLQLEPFLSRKILRREVVEYIVILSILLYTIIFSYFTIYKHSSFETYAWDLGIFDQSLWTTINEGKLLYHSLDLYLNPSGSFFGVHFSPILFLILPVYALWQHPETLLILQSLILSSAAFPLYLIVKRKFQNRTIGFVFVLTYLSYPALHGINWFDFHIQSFFPLLLFSAFHFFDKKNWKGYFLFVILALMVEEQVAIVLVFYGMYLFWTFKEEVYHSIKNKVFNTYELLVPLLTIVLSGSYLFIIRFIKSIFFPINSIFLIEYQALFNWSVLGIQSDPTQMPIYVLLNPEAAITALSYDFSIKFLFFLFLFAPLAFLSFKSSFVLITLAWLGPALLSNNPAYYTLGSQYPAYIIPFIFMSAILSLKHLSKKNLKVAIDFSKILLILIPIFVLGLSPISPYPKFFNAEYVPSQITEHDQILQNVLTYVPSNASVLTQNNIFPHLSHRSNVYAVYPHPATESVTEKTFEFTDNLTSNVQYILVDLTSDKTAFEYALGRATNSSYGLYISVDNILLFQLDYHGSPIILSPLSETYDFHDLNLGHGDWVLDSTSNSTAVITHLAENPITNVFWSGPYTSLPPGNYSVSYKLKIDELKNGELLTLDVAANGGTLVLARKRLHIMEFEKELKWQNFSISFNLDKTYIDVEFRGIDYSNLTQVYLDQIYLNQDK